MEDLPQQTGALEREWDYHDLMAYRIHEILIVASPYDAFILEEDGRLDQQILHQYLGINLRYAPRIWRASSASEAMKMLNERRFDLVLTMLRVPDLDPIEFGRKVKERNPEMPVVLLVFDRRQLREVDLPIPTEAIDRAFIWAGNAQVLMAIIKSMEDMRNVERDVGMADIRTVLVIEDEPHYYSIFLPLIYSEVFFHTRNLLDVSLNDTDRLLRLRARPKILHASSFEEAEEYFDRYRLNILGIISDTRFPRAGSFHEYAGIEFAKSVRELDPAMPIMLQSSALKNAELAAELRARFLHKHSKTLLQDLREFLTTELGFGDFVFIHDGVEVARAGNLFDLKEALETIPDETLLTHARSNHFSNWTAARGHLALASVLRPVSPDDFSSPMELRQFLIKQIDKARRLMQEGRVVEFSPETYDPEALMTTITTGSLGGKARGLAFASAMLTGGEIEKTFPDVKFSIPRFAVIGTDEFDRFMEVNSLLESALDASSNGEVDHLFLGTDLGEDLVERLRFYLEKHTFPISVRSSSLLEDSQFHSLAGMYSTFILPNCVDDPAVRLEQLCNAIKLVYASTFYQAPKAFLESTIHRPEEEKMAVIIQELAGQEYGSGRFYPTFSGLVQSTNYYPISYLQREEGAAYIALGLGMTVVENERSLRFSPHHPQILPQFFSPEATLENSQREFYAMPAECQEDDLLKRGVDANMSRFGLEEAREDGSLRWVGSVLDARDNIIRDSLSYKGAPIVSFAPMLKWKTFPLAELLAELLTIGEHAVGCPVEIEFAGNLYEEKDRNPEFYFLQIRPMAGTGSTDGREFRGEIDAGNCFCVSCQALGNGVYPDLRDIVFVKPDTFTPSRSREIAREIGRINSQFDQDTPYLLIGPGRWGTADPLLGIPVTWDQISYARVIVEYNLEHFLVDPSFGGHFFQNLTSLRIGYLTASCQKKIDLIDWEWLNTQPVKSETGFVKWIELEKPCTVWIDSMEGTGYCLRPDAGEL